MGNEQSFTPSWQNKTLTPPPLTRAHAISFLPGYQSTDITSGGFVMPGQQPVAAIAPPSPFAFPMQQNSFIGGQQSSGFVLPTQSDLKNRMTKYLFLHEI